MVRVGVRCMRVDVIEGDLDLRLVEDIEDINFYDIISMTKLSRYINKIVKSREEKKIIDLEYSGTIPNEGTLVDLSQMPYIAQGTSMVQRIGNSIDVTSIQMRGIIFIPPGATLDDYPNYVVRLIIFQWFSDPYTNLPTVSDIIETYEASTQFTSWASQYNKENAGKYHILYDKMYTLSFYGESIKTFNVKISNIPLKTIPYSNLVVAGHKYNTTGSIYAIFISDVDEAAYEPAVYQYTSRLTFTDS